MLLRQFIFIALYFYLKILNISCEERRTLAFAIDNTGSMENDIYNVKKGARKILDIVSSKKSTIEKFVLVAINDPKVKLLENTPNRNRFQASLNNLKISVDRKNRDCEEKSLSGIKLALRVSGPESYLYTFTDANAKDFTILSEITTLCQEKQTQIVTVFSIEKKCYYPEVRNFTAYYDIAKACSGQVFIVEKDEVNEVLKTIEILLQGKNSIFKWTMVPNSSKDAVTFTLDKKAEYALVSASGSNVTLKITTENDPNSPECPLDKIMSTNNGKFVKISNTNPGGTYYVWVKASSSVNVVVYGRTDFTFEYGFSDGELSKKESLKIKQPTAGLTQKLLINVYDLDHSVKMKTAQLFTIKNNKPVSVKMPLENVHDDLYITNAFIAPTETFRIEVEGIIKKANESITRYSSNIDPQLVLPVIQSINKGHVLKGSKIELICKIIQGFPKPLIKWYKKNRNKYIPLDVTGEVLTVNHALFKHVGEYKCTADNGITKTVEAKFDVIVHGLPEISIDKTERQVMFNNNDEITCKVASYPSPSIVWKNETGFALNGKVENISEYEFYNHLTLNNVRRNATYICEARNDFGNWTESVIIYVLSPFKVKNISIGKTNLNYGSETTILCEITSSEPMNIRWYIEKNDKSSKTVINSSDKYAISADRTELTIKSMDIDMNGTYSCEASLLHVPSEIKRNRFEVNIVGLDPPEINATEINLRVEKGEIIELDCKIIRGTPKPHVRWFKKNENNYVPIASVRGEVLRVNTALYAHSGQYKCEATNEIATATATYDVAVSGLPEIFVNGTTRLVQYNNDDEITCKVASYPRPNILWKNEHGLVLENRVQITSKHEFYNRLTLHNLKKSAIYICEASNVYGSMTKQVNITVSSPFVVQKLTQDKTDVNYGSPQVILCKITSSEPMGIRWYREKHVKSSKIIIESSDKYAISADDTELTIKSMDIDTNGTYSCEASLLHVPSEITRNTFEVNVVGFASPKIKSTDLNNKVMRKEKFELACNIAQGTPKPHLKWFKKSDNSSEYVPISGANSEVFGVNESSFSHAGQYKCEATNEIDTATATFDVTVSGMPQIFIDNTEKQVSYNSYADITCKVEAYPPPSIVWMNETGTVLETKIEITSGYEFGNQLKLKNLKKNATIVCEARNKFGFIRKSVKILVSSPFVVKNVTHAITDIMYGSEKTIQCGISSKEKMNIRWYRQENDILSKMVISSSDKYDISSDGTELTIKSMDIDMNGTYSCEASLSSDPSEKASYSEEITVDGVNKPEVTYIMSHLNETLLMAICRIKAVPKPSIWWEFKPKGAKVFTVISRSSDEFKISEPKLKDSGVYKCKAKNILGETEHKFDITVEERPNILTNNSAYFGLERDLVMKIPCNVTGFPEPTIVWKKEDKPIRGDDKYRITGTALYINKPVQSDSAEYTCEAKNKLGNAIVKALVEIDDDFVDSYNYIYNGEIVETYVDTFEPKPIKCELENFGDDSVRWYQDGELTEHKGSTYFVEPDSTAYSSNYTCRVNTDEGSKSETYLVFFGYKPNFFNSLRNKINWRRNNQMLDCKAEADPEPKYEWFHNERAVVETENYMSKVHISGWGNYTCVVSNVLGNISRNFKVHTLGCFITKHIASQNQPLITNTDTPMWPPYMRNNGVLIKKNEEIKFSCPKNTKSTNYFKSIPGKIEVTAKCKTEDTFYVDGKVYRYSELECSTKVEPTVKDTKEQCAGPNTEMLRIGYEVNGFLDVYEVCYNKSLNVPLYARVSNKIYGDEENIDVTKFNWSSVLKLSHGKAENSCYTRRQLVSAKKIAFGPAQAATFKDDLNSILIWNTSCDGSGRKTWQNYDDETVEEETTWKGASGYALIDGVGLVPRYLWKVLATGEGYSVMVYVNGAAPTARDVRCAAPAHEACAWLADEGDALYCCTLEHFVDAFGLSLDKINSKLPVD